jgi:hypothetical protein
VLLFLKNVKNMFRTQRIVNTKNVLHPSQIFVTFNFLRQIWPFVLLKKLKL